jgi:hypothetical protein
MKERILSIKNYLWDRMIVLAIMLLSHGWMDEMKQIATKKRKKTVKSNIQC